MTDKITLVSSKKSYGEQGSVRDREDCDTEVIYDVPDDVEMANRSPQLWCPECGQTHRFMMTQEALQ